MAHGHRSPLWRVALLAATAWLLPTAADAQDQAPFQKVTCSFANMLDKLRAGLKTGSPAYRKYLLLHIKEAARAMPPGELMAAVEQERDPEVLAALGAALATHAGYVEDRTVVEPLLRRAANDADPSVRAAALRGLRGTASVETMEKNGNKVTYEQLVRDPSPEVREAVAANLIEESAKVFFGHDKTVSETAVNTAQASPDPEVAAKLLREVSMEQVGHEAVEKITRQLKAENPSLRAASATALGGVPGPEAVGASGALIELYRNERDPAVRKAALQGIVRLGLGSALPTLQSLRGVAPTLDPEIDAWTAALKLNLQEWHLLLREKEKIRK